SASTSAQGQRPPLVPYTTLFRSLPAKNPDRSDDRPRRLGAARRAGRSRLHTVGRQRRFRCVFAIHGDGDGRNEVLRLDGRKKGKDRKSTRLNSSHQISSYDVLCL